MNNSDHDHSEKIPPAHYFYQGAALVLCVTALYFGQNVLLPIAVAILLSFLLAPVVRRFESWNLPSGVAVTATIILALGLFAGVMTTVAGQVVKLAEELPKYEATFQSRVEFLREKSPHGVVRAVDVLQDIGGETFFTTTEQDSPAGTDESSSSGGNDAGEDDTGEEDTVAIPVEVRQGDPTLLDMVEKYVTPAIGSLVRVGMVVILTIFILYYRRDLRDRLLRLLGSNNTRVTDQALNEAGGRVSGYLMMQFVNNVAYGLTVGIGLWLIGLPGAVFWGMAAMLVRFIPYLGPWIGAMLPILMSLGVFDDWLHPLLVVGMFVGLELLFNNVIEPHLFGAGAGISPIAVIVALFFWGWVWGGVGLLVAVPLTACLVVAGRYIPQLEGLTILLSDHPERDARCLVTSGTPNPEECVAVRAEEVQPIES